MALPKFTYHGLLPEGVHDCQIEELQEPLVTNPQREELWRKLRSFLEWAKATDQFSFAYIGGGFITDKISPEDVDVILQTSASYGPGAFIAMEPFFSEGMDAIYQKYAVHLHFWCEGFPNGVSDFRRFFQYLRPQDAAPLGLREGARKGIVRIKL